MTLSMHQASTPMYVQTLKALSAILEKAQGEVDAGRMGEAELMEARLAPDMFPLARQIQIASDMAKGGVARLACCRNSASRWTRPWRSCANGLPGRSIS